MDRRVYRYNFQNDYECSSNIDCGENGECFNNNCNCNPGFEYDHFKRLCVLCPGEGEFCDTCCNSKNLSCMKSVCVCANEDYFSICSNAQTGVFVTASQIALSAALIMGIAALAMVIYRLCTKPRYLSRTRHQAAAERLSEGCARGNTSYLRASLSSIQIRVLSRLRDRPPAYETQTRTVSQQVEIQPRNLTDPEAPPPYEGQELRRSHQPPPYAEIIASPAGYLNPTFVNSETSVTNNKLEKSGDTKLLKEETCKPE